MRYRRCWLGDESKPGAVRGSSWTTALACLSHIQKEEEEEEEATVPRAALYEEVRKLVDDGAQLVEVLPEGEYAKLHLPGARNIPLKRLDAETTADLDIARPVVVYCHDAL